MTESKICTCPSGDGSLRWPCPAHPAVEQAGGDERAAFELFVRKHCGMPEHIAVNWDAKFTNDAWEGWQARAALAQPSPAQAVQAEAERPVVVAYADPIAFATFKKRGHEGGVLGREWMWAEPSTGLVAMSRTDECECIIGELRSERDAANARLHEVATACATAEQERDAALARVAELDKQCRDDVARALGLRPSHERERGFAWSYLLASIKSCVKASEDIAQAQHSVPEGWMLVECGIWTQEQVDEMQRTVARFRSSEFVDDRALAMAVADAGQCKAPEISLAELLAAAPGKEGV